MSSASLPDFPSSSLRLTEALARSRRAAAWLRQSGAAPRSQALKLMGDAVMASRDRILEANTLDLEISREMAIPERVTDWLKLTPERVQRAADILRRLGMLGDFPGAAVAPIAWAGTAVYKPLGVVALVYESFPELAAIAAGLCLRTGNALVLKGGNEASQTSQVLVSVLLDAIAKAELPTDVLLLVPQTWDEVTRKTVVQQPELDLVIPCGRPQLVEQVVSQAIGAVLPTCLGNCCLCVGASAQLEQVAAWVADSHQGDPDAVNRVETLVLAGNFTADWLQRLEQALAGRSLTMTLVSAEGGTAEGTETGIAPALTSSGVRVRSAANVTAAAEWINQHSSGHADGIATANLSEARQFLATVNSASVFVNASPRFYRNPAAAHNIALGMTNQRSLGGRVGLGALVRSQRVLYGQAAAPPLGS